MPAVPMGARYLRWFAALRWLRPVTASMATLLTPLVGFVAAAIALGEPFGVREMLAPILPGRRFLPRSVGATWTRPPDP